jgi:hypothetical protein
VPGSLQIDPQSFGIVAVGLVILSIAFGIWRRREAIIHQLAAALVAVGIAFVVVWIALQFTDQPTAQLIGFLAGFATFFTAPKRSRRVSRKVRRRAIARFELKTGERYSPRKHELDHSVPFSRGGSGTFDNIRVVPKSYNRKKSSKAPWWDVIGRLG